MIDWPAIKVTRGDMRDVLKTYPADHFDSGICDPPYGYSFMGRGWDHGVPGVEFWREYYRVLKPGAHLVAFGGTRTFHRLACAIEDAGFEIRDSLGWHHYKRVFCQCYEPTRPKTETANSSAMRAVRESLDAEDARTIGTESVLLEDVRGQSAATQADTGRIDMPDVREAISPAAMPPEQERGELLLEQLPKQDIRSTAPGDSKGRQHQGNDSGSDRETIGEDARPEQPGMERRRDVEASEGELQRGEVRSLAGMGSVDGAEGRLHHGTPASDDAAMRSTADTDRSGASPRPHAEPERRGQSRAMAVEWIPQGDGAWPGCPRCHKPLAPPFDAGPLAWQYGTGYHKGLDVAKAIDKQRHDRDDVLEVCRWIRDRRDAVGITNADIDAAFGFNGMAGHWTSAGTQPAVPTIEQVPGLLTVLRVTEADVPARVRELLVELNGKKGEFGAAWHAREVTGTVEEWTDRSNYAITSRDGLRRDVPHSADAQKWSGWSSSVKPAWEPIVLARKPLPNGWTIAETVLEHGTGALNIGATAIAFMSDADRAATAGKNRHADFDSDPRGQTRAFGADNRKRGNYEAESRIPANVILDPAAAAQLDRQAGDEVSRFFYCAKASTDERDAGLTNPLGGGLSPTTNIHNTVKPLALMRWLCRLVTPPGGKILDAFAGSGSTLCAGTLEGFAADGVDLDTDEATGEPLGYVEIARARSAYWRGEAIRLAEGGARPPADAAPAQLDIF